MPEYRIVSEADPGPDHREPRGARLRLDEAREVTVTEARGISELLEDIERGFPSAGEARVHQDRRIVSVEEVHPGFSCTDEEITAALADPTRNPNRDGLPLVDPEEFEDGSEPLYGGDGFIYVVHDVAEGLRESGLVPGLHVSLLQNASGYVDYSMVEVHDDARATYLSRGAELKHLTDDRSAVGWAGVLAIARELVSLSRDLH